MRRLSSLILLPILVIASACSKNNYAQVEPDDLYFTHKDRKAAQAYSNSLATTASVAIADAPNTVSEADISSYSSQHSPTLYSTTLGSPTIQLYEQPFYDASQNPDYLVQQEGENVAGVSDVYYTDDYASYNQLPATSAPQVVNNYYGTNPYASNWSNYSYSPYSSFYGRSRYFSPFYFSVSYGYNPYSWNSYNSYYGYRSYYDPFYNNNYYTSYAYCPITYGNSYSSGYYLSNGYYNANNVTNYYGDNNTDYNTKTLNSDGSVTGPRTSRSSVSYYANKNNYNVVRRDNYKAGDETGRIAIEDARFTSDYNVGRSNPVTINRRSSQGSNIASRQVSSTPSSGTIQRTSDSERRYRTTKVRRSVANTGSSGTVNRNAATQRQISVNPATSGQKSYVIRSSNRQSAYNNNRATNNSNRATRTRYTTPAKSGSGNAYRRSTTNSYTRTQSGNTRSRSSYSAPNKSRTRSSYTPSRSNTSRTRSVSTPSRSSSTQRSSTRSSSSSSTKSSSSKRKN